MKQQYNNYTAAQSEVWQTLFERQVQNLNTYGSKAYLTCLKALNPVLQAKFIPNFDKLNQLLYSKSGWTIEVVKGLIPVNDFFQLLTEQKFCSSTWLRSMAELDYLEEPDMFHDIFGHIPLLLNPDFSKFTKKLGQLGFKYQHKPEIVRMLQRIYWFTIEFGLIEEDGQLKCYGAGLISSFGETNHIFDGNITLEPYNIAKVIHQNFITDQIQSHYYVITDFEALYTSIDEFETLVQVSLKI